MNDKIKLIVRQIIDWLAAGDFENIVRCTKGIRMSGTEIESAVQDYGRTVSIPPESAFNLMDVVEVKGGKSPQFSVRMPLWTLEEGRSDLSIDLTIKMAGGKTEVELDDIHVL